MKVLFVGNSYTMYNDVPQSVTALAKSVQADVVNTMTAQGGASWRVHVEELGTPKVLEQQRPDRVVLQNKSTEALLERDDFHTFGGVLIDKAKSVGADVLLYQTWAWHPNNEAYKHRWSKKSPQAWLSEVVDQYAKLGDAHKISIAPVGEAWANCMRAHPELRLHDEDDHHAAPNGSYLAACVLAAKLLNNDANQFDWCPPTIEAETSLQLRQIAASTLLNDAAWRLG